MENPDVLEEVDARVRASIGLGDDPEVEATSDESSDESLNEAFKVWKFEYKEKMSLTSDDSFLINIKNIKKKFE